MSICLKYLHDFPTQRVQKSDGQLRSTTDYAGQMEGDLNRCGWRAWPMIEETIYDGLVWISIIQNNHGIVRM